MVGSVNKVTLLGNLGKDPEIRSTNEGKKIANFTIATSEQWKDKMTGERREKTEWHNIVAFSEGLVRVIENYLKKGSKVYIEGQLQTRKWTDKNGVDRYSTEIVLQGFNSQLVMLDSRNSGGGSSNNNDSGNYYQPNNNQSQNNNTNNNQQQAPAEPETFDDDIPF